MSHFYNGIDAAKRIGIAYKTLLRWIEKGKIIPEEAKTPAGQLLISEEQVEKLRSEIVQERAMLGQSKTSTDGHSNIAIQVDIGMLTQKVARLEKRVAELERQSQAIVDSPSMSIPDSPSHSSTLTPQPQKSIVEPYSTSMISASEFAAQVGLSYNDMKNIIKRGIGGEKLDVTERPHHIKKRNGVPIREYFLDESQQKKAVELLKRHGKIS